ncbi:MAG: DUF2971 domain-containing protein [Aeromonas veronii]
MAPPSRLEGFREGRGWGRIPPVLLHGGGDNDPTDTNREMLMDIVYKYSGLLPLDYFKKPTIKLSVPEHLNDPFEYNTSKNIVKAIKKSLLGISYSEEMADELSSNSEKYIINMISFNGIVSFTETPRNSLMWAHYSSHHNGMCIGYKSNLLSHIKENKNGFRYITINKPTKINYDNMRFSNDHEYINVTDSSRDSVIKHLLTKSDEWIYEKEHRCIIPYLEATKLMINKNDIDKYILELKGGDRKPISGNEKFRVGSFIENLESYGWLQRIDSGDDNTLLYRTIKPKDEKDIGLYDSYFQLLTNVKELSFLIDVDAYHIDSVYFGCKVKKDVVKSYYKEIKSNIKIYHLRVCDERFELIPTRVNEDYFN